jgi:tRNA A37 threonylcarbamoyladenosine synthetase subunit TsaC/SUA5/YrdC
VTIVRIDEPGLRQVRRALDASIPVVLPLPAPLPYVIAGSDAAAVNLAKGRPAGQATGVAVADFTLVTPYVELDEDTLTFARWLSAHELLNLMLPVGEGGPAWMRPSTSKGWLGVMLGWLGQIRPLLDERGHLYVSSANRTGAEAAVAAATANAAFGDAYLVIDGDAARDQSVASGSATIVRVGPRRQVDVVRHGINDAGFAGDSNRFLQELTLRWRTSRPS